ncbi:MAG TPA: hypothetical protein VEO73_07320, partial [Gemmatimonadales bacterium]|nr:hypothetical protein [Gemmatimonadales bacterium]
MDRDSPETSPPPSIPVSGLARWRFAAGAVAVLTALAPLVLAHWGAARYARGTAERLAISTAAYMELVSPAARGSSDYDLPR